LTCKTGPGGLLVSCICARGRRPSRHRRRALRVEGLEETAEEPTTKRMQQYPPGTFALWQTTRTPPPSTGSRSDSWMVVSEMPTPLVGVADTGSFNAIFVADPPNRGRGLYPGPRHLDHRQGRQAKGGATPPASSDCVPLPGWSTVCPAPPGLRTTRVTIDFPGPGTVAFDTVPGGRPLLATTTMEPCAGQSQGLVDGRSHPLPGPDAAGRQPRCELHRRERRRDADRSG
jgi:hypothetical protein